MENQATSATTDQTNANRAIVTWLFMVAALIFAMVLVGGATRLTGSGLSITEWKPILGAIPPLSEADWQDAFQKYKQIPQYKEINRGMSLSEFKGIYWWEWGHRFLGRFIGIAFLLPFLYFLFKGQVAASLKPKLWGLFALGALQGFVGWYMVASGLVERTEVSQYRLAMHLGLAIFIYGAILWVAFGLMQPKAIKEQAPPRLFKPAMTLICGLIFLQIIAGAFVAGLRAGMAYNTWPLMDGRLIPTDLLLLEPAWRNLFENVRTVQFDHRMIAYLLFVAILAYAVYAVIKGQAGRLAGSHVRAAIWLLIIAAGQMALGIITLLKVVPLDWALAHQAGALILLTAALWHRHQLNLSPPSVKNGFATN